MNFFHNIHHSVWCNIVGNIAQNSRIQISVEQITDFRSDNSWENDQLPINIVSILLIQWVSAKIHERSKKYSIFHCHRIYVSEKSLLWGYMSCPTVINFINCCSLPTLHVLDGTMSYIESMWTLNMIVVHCISDWYLEFPPFDP